MTSRRAYTRAALAVATVALAGCGIANPDAATPPAHPRAAAAARQPSRPRSGHNVLRAGGDRAVITRFAHAWMTYTFATLPAQQRELAALATGRLARELLADSEQSLQAQYTRVSDARSHGIVEAIVLRPGQPAIVVIRTSLAIDGPTQTDWNVYLATVQATATGPRIAAWTPATSD